MRPFRFGVQLSWAPDGPSWRAKARKAEELGYSTVFVPDHLDAQWGPLVAMTVAAEATTTLRVGSLVLANDFRNPVVLAKEIATLDVVCEGRVEFGIGAGWRKKDYLAAGLPMDSAQTRIDRLGESVAVLKDIWAAAASQHRGEHYRVAVRHGVPVPRSVPHPPIIIGGGGERILSLAAREADIVGVNPKLAAGRVDLSVLATTGPDAFDRRIAWVRAAAGERWDVLELQCLTVICRITGDRAAALRAFARASGMSPEALDAAPSVLAGSVEEVCETLEQRRAAWGLSYWVVHEQEMADFAPVVGKLSGC